MRRTPEDEFTLLVNAAGPRVLGYLVRRTVPRDDAADLLAEVLLIAWRRLNDLPRDPEQRVHWLIGVARRVLANHRRGQSRRVALADRLRDHLASVVPDHAPVSDEVVAITGALDSLSDEDRELLELIAWEGLSSADAAHVLGITPAAARQRLHRARARLRTELQAVPGRVCRPAAG